MPLNPQAIEDINRIRKNNIDEIINNDIPYLSVPFDDAKTIWDCLEGFYIHVEFKNEPISDIRYCGILQEKKIQRKVVDYIRNKWNSTWMEQKWENGSKLDVCREIIIFAVGPDEYNRIMLKDTESEKIPEPTEADVKESQEKWEQVDGGRKKKNKSKKSSKKTGSRKRKGNKSMSRKKKTNKKR
jgi:hypothetical protein